MKKCWKIIFFRDLYDIIQNDNGKNSIKTRRKKDYKVIKKYNSYYNSNETGVIIMADFNLNIYNRGEKTYSGTAVYKNFTYELPDDKFIAQIKSPITLNQYDFKR